MAFKFIALFALVSAASAGHLTVGPAYTHGAYAVAAPAYVKSYAAPTLVKTLEYEAPAQYDFSYGVSDSLTGDHKSQVESRQGDNVHGSYSLIDSDGFKRTVDYTADEHNGFNAVVRREPLGHAVAAPVAKVVAAPVAQYAPVQYAAQYAPVAKVAYASAAPVAYSAYSAPVAKVVSPVVASAHYAPSIVAGAGHYAAAAHYAPAAYAATAHYAPAAYATQYAPAGHVYHH